MDLPPDLKRLIFNLAGGGVNLACRLRCVNRSWKAAAQYFLLSVHINSLRSPGGRNRLRQIARLFPHLTELDLGMGCNFARALAPFTNLRILRINEIKRGAYLQDLSFPFPVMTSLTSLSTPMTPAFLRVLPLLPRLTDLCVYPHKEVLVFTQAWPVMTSVVNLRVHFALPIEALALWTNLKHLSLQGSSLHSRLRAPPSLTSLDVWQCNRFFTLPAVCTCLTSLRALSDWNYPLNPHLPSLLGALCESPAASGLRRLWLRDEMHNNCDPLGNLKRLEELVMSPFVQPNISFLRPLTALQTLVLYRAPRLRNEGLEALRHLPQLTELDCTYSSGYFFTEKTADHFLAAPKLRKLRAGAPRDVCHLLEQRLRSTRTWELLRIGNARYEL